VRDVAPPSFSPEPIGGEFDDVPLASSGPDDIHVEVADAWSALDNMPALSFTLDDVDDLKCKVQDEQASRDGDQVAAVDFAILKPERPFHKWMKSLR
jgi:hypothetical protein